jgi:hypothetical protein
MRKKLTWPLPAALVVLAGLTFGMCSDDDDSSCNEQYLTATTTTSLDGATILYYNDAQKLSTTLYRGDGVSEDSSRTDFFYDSDGRLTEMLMKHRDPLFYNTRYKFRYDGDRVMGIRREFPTGGHDTLAFKYDAAGRIIQRDYFSRYYDFEQGHEVTTMFSSYTIEYISETKMTVTFSEFDGTTGLPKISKKTYTMDGKKKPFPEEYYIATLAWLGVVYPSNPVLIEDRPADGTIYDDVRSYSYNKSGRPVTMNQSVSVEDRFIYACEPPKE